MITCLPAASNGPGPWVRKVIAASLTLPVFLCSERCVAPMWCLIGKREVAWCGCTAAPHTTIHGTRERIDHIRMRLDEMSVGMTVSSTEETGVLFIYSIVCFWSVKRSEKCPSCGEHINLSQEGGNSEWFRLILFYRMEQSRFLHQGVSVSENLVNNGLGIGTFQGQWEYLPFQSLIQ